MDANKHTLVRTSVIVRKPECFGQMHDLKDPECMKCEITIKCILKAIHNVDNEIKKVM